MFEHLKIALALMDDPESVSEEEKEHLREYEIKCALVRFIYKEKMQSMGTGLVDFHFTPGSSFMETPIYDIVHELVEMNRKIASGEIKVTPLVFDDMRIAKSNPPVTGQEKTELK